MNKKINISIISGVIALSSFIPTISLASELNNNATNISTISTSTKKVVEENNDFIRIEDEKGITILFKNLIQKDNKENESENEYENITRRPYYRVKNTRFVKEFIDFSDPIKTISGNSGVVLNISHEEDRSSTISSDINVAYSIISAAFGYKVNKNFTITYDGTYTVPSNVKKAVLTAYPIYDKFEYDICLKNPLGGMDVQTGKGEFIKPVGIHYEKKLVY